VSRHKPLPKVYIDTFEFAQGSKKRPCKTAAHLLCSDLIECKVKKLGQGIEEMGEDGTSYNPTGDYVVVDKKGQITGIERKALQDLYNSITKGRVVGQLTELVEKFGDRAILLLEDGYITPKCGVPAWKVRETCLSFASHRSLIMPVFYTTGPEHSAREIIELARCEIKEPIKGRGIIVQKVRDI